MLHEMYPPDDRILIASLPYRRLSISLRRIVILMRAVEAGWRFCGIFTSSRSRLQDLGSRSLARPSNGARRVVHVHSPFDLFAQILSRAWLELLSKAEFVLGGSAKICVWRPPLVRHNPPGKVMRVLVWMRSAHPAPVWCSTSSRPS